MQLFAAIDFETASGERNSACAIGYVIFNHSKIIKKKSYLIKPPKPEVHFTEIHGLTWDMLKKEKTFDKVWRLIKMNYSELIISLLITHLLIGPYYILAAIIIISIFPHKSLKTLLFSPESIGISKYKLNTVCKNLRIPLNHHDALSDAKGCALIAIEAFKKGFSI